MQKPSKIPSLRFSPVVAQGTFSLEEAMLQIGAMQRVPNTQGSPELRQEPDSGVSRGLQGRPQICCQGSSPGEEKVFGGQSVSMKSGAR